MPHDSTAHEDAERHTSEPSVHRHEHDDRNQADPHHDESPHGHDHDHDHDHGRDHGHHGHENDQGIKGTLRYLRWFPQMWRSTVNDAVVDLVGLRPGERAVDIGAGVGAGAIRAAATGAVVIAVEPTPFVRRVLRLRRIVSRRRATIEVVDGAAEQIPVADRTIDAIWAVNTMHHWVDIERGVTEVARILRPGGRVLLVDEVFTDPSHPDYERFGTEHGPEHHGFTLVDAETMGGLLRAAGLVDVEASNLDIADRPVIRVAARGAPATER